MGEPTIHDPKVRYRDVSDLEMETGLDHFVVCEDCGVLVARYDRAAHTRSHSIGASHAWAIAVLLTTHLAAHIHDRYDTDERVHRKRFDNWAADALAEVMAEMDTTAPTDTTDEEGT